VLNNTEAVKPGAAPNMSPAGCTFGLVLLATPPTAVIDSQALSTQRSTTKNPTKLFFCPQAHQAPPKQQNLINQTPIIAAGGYEVPLLLADRDHRRRWLRGCFSP